MTTSRLIAHVDLDAFFASVEQRDHPAWRGRPVLVGGRGKRGVVAAASYEARAFGCRSAQPMAVALRNCPGAIVAPPRGHAYREASDAVFALIDALTPDVQPLSVDEAFLDLTGVVRTMAEAHERLETFRRTVLDDVRLTISAGLAPNPFIAKLASDENKPNGMTVIDVDEVEAYLRPLPIERMWGVGRKMAPRFHDAGIHTFADLIDADAEYVGRLVGRDVTALQALARGEDGRRVVSDRHARSYSQERTFGDDLGHPDIVLAVLQAQVEHVALRVRRANRRARTITLKIRDGQFTTVTRSATFDDPTDRTDRLWTMARDVFERWARSSFVPVRLIGFSVSQVEDANPELLLFDDADDARQRRLDAVTDRIAERFGPAQIRRGLSMQSPTSRRDVTRDRDED